MRVLVRILSVFVVAVLVPSMVYAQASIAGVVRDTSGAVLPGVTVEAASPALIEKVRTATSDDAGQYRIIDLRPGTYTVTFTLLGFATVKREGVELAGDFVATVNAELRVGALEETITVTGASPVVDVQSTRGQRVMDREVIRDIPTSRQYYSVATLIPGMVITAQDLDVGGSAPPRVPDFVIHGGRVGDGRLSVDGITLGQRGSEGSNRSMYLMNVGQVQETTISTSGGLGEAETSGVAINMVPREGGNTVRGSFYAAYANGAMQGSNFDDALRATGLRSPNELKAVWEVTPQVGGPLRADKVWYFTSFRHQGTRNWIAGMYYNKNAGDVTKWTYEPDFSRRALEDATYKAASLRLTWQASARNKVNVYWDEQQRKTGWIGGGSATQAPDAASMAMSLPVRARTLTWSSPRTNRLLFEAGAGGTQLQWGSKERPGYNRNLIRVQEQAGSIPGLSYRGMTWNSNWLAPYQLRGSVSYVTGTHTSKVGFQHTWNNYNDDAADPQGIEYRFNNGVPNQVTLNDAPRTFRARINTLGIYAQDAWVIGKLTLQGGVRYDYLTSGFPEQIVGFNRFVPNGFVIPDTNGPRLHDITPRMAAAYDLAGDGKTALKVTLGKYIQAQETGPLGESFNPTRRRAISTNRAWNDANRNFVPDCDLLNPDANGECGPYSNRNFGKNVFNNTYDPDLLEGWGIRQYNWEFSASVQREVLPRVGVNFGYFRRWYGNHVVADNRAVGPEDFDRFSIVVPADSRLPGGGGYTIDGFLNVKPAKFGLTDNLVTTATKYGGKTEYWQGIDLNVNARAVNGLTVQGGLSTGRATVDECRLAETLPENFASPSLGFGGTLVFGSIFGNFGQSVLRCRVQEPFLTQVKGLASYLVPRLDVLVSTTFQSSPGIQLGANFNAPNALVAPSLGRNLAGNAANVTVNLVESGKQYGDRINLLDLRVAKVLRFGRTRTNVGVDLYNALNANAGTGYNQTFGPRYLTPTLIMPARFVKLNLQVDW